MAPVDTAPFLLVRRSDPPAEVLRYRSRLRLCRAAFVLALTGVSVLLAYEVTTAKDAGSTVATMIPRPLR